MQVEPRDQRVKLLPALVVVEHPEGVDLVLFEAGEGEILEALDDVVEIGPRQLAESSSLKLMMAWS